MKENFFHSKLIAVIILFFILGNTNLSLAQNNTYQIKGVVLDSLEIAPVEMAIVSIVDLGIWSRSDEEGRFVLNNVPAGTHRIRFYLLGYKELTITRTIHSNIEEWIQKIQPTSLSLNEVTVTATENKLGSISTIGREAIEHIQPKSLTDIFQLLPGQITDNPTLSSPGQVKIREITENDNSALGTLVIVDGAPISNDANMQTINTSRSGKSFNETSYSGRGIDLRDISADNLESVEVIKGVPSAEYGNLTSGVVLVKTKIGEQPWTAKLKTDPNTKIGSIYKGLRLPERSGILNVGADYAEAYDDIREKSNGYKRLTATVAYSNTFLNKTNPLDVNIRLSGYSTIDENKSDPEMNNEELKKTSQKGFRWGVDGKWMLRKSWITNLEYSISGDYASNTSRTKSLQVLSTGAVPYPTSYENGMFEEQYLPGVFYSDYTTDGKPYNTFAKLKGNWSRQFFQRTLNSVKMGLDFSLTGNNGRGLEYDISRPPMLNLTTSIRPRAPKDIPTLKNYAFFIEDKVVQPIGTTELTVQAGTRFVKVQPGNFHSVEPRINTSFEFLNKKNNQLFDHFSIDIGYGLSSKMPTLSYISPDNAYFDNMSLNYLDGENSLAVVSTEVLNTSNPNLKPARSTKKELGLSFRINKVSVSLTAYHEKLKDGLSFYSTPHFSFYEKFTVNGAGKMPEFENGKVYYYENGNRLEAPSSTNVATYTYNTPANNQTLIKKGFEYIVDLGKIKAINTSFVIDGAWLWQESYNTLPTYTTISQLLYGEPYPYIAVMPANYKTIRQRINTNIRMITHVPQLKMIVSLTSQIVWNSKFRYRWDDENGNSLIYYYDDNGNRVYGDAALKDMSTTRYVDPIGFMDNTGTIHDWKPEYSTHNDYQAMVRTYSESYYFVEESLPPAVQFNLRLTKEFSRNLTLSFMANNFLKMNPLQKSNRTSLDVKRNTRFYFGAEINYKF
ncbi:MAG: TonB-dependent receptor [Prevotella sp.]|jgi:hypothetical protein|nr:TonB-dependent receptor [Prevotella sp.]